MKNLILLLCLSISFVHTQKESSDVIGAIPNQKVDKPNIKKEKNFNFRKTMWGDSIEKVKSSESGELIPETGSDMLGYSGIVAGGLEAIVGYYFIDNKLWKARFLFIETHTSDNQYFYDYLGVWSELSEKYGKAKEADAIWSNELYKGDKNNLGFAISLGHLYNYFEWEIDDTIIKLEIDGDNYKINHRLTYTSKTHKKLYEQKKKETKSSDF